MDLVFSTVFIKHHSLYTAADQRPDELKRSPAFSHSHFSLEAYDVQNFKFHPAGNQICFST